MEFAFKRSYYDLWRGNINFLDISENSLENLSISLSVTSHILENDLARPLKSSSVIIVLKSSDQSIIEALVIFRL